MAVKLEWGTGVDGIVDKVAIAPSEKPPAS